ncbi:glutathione S-transferase family protein [Pseudomonas sp. NY11955]|uniref:glutathione S-transferase family protein n=1 Tax=Pseudomonas sp. NY11955 TaxID=3400363 RepID=UPI003A88CFE4
MLRLHGFPASNYYNMVKLALLLKGLPFEEVPLYGCRNPKTLAMSPRGKVPVLETEQGFLSETDAILDYLEESCEVYPLLPGEPFARATTRALAKEIELYIELPARYCYAEVFFGGRPTPEALKAKAKRDLEKGFEALRARGRFSPYVAGEYLTVADIYFLYSVDLAQVVGERLFDVDYLEALPGATALLKRLGSMAEVRRVAADREVDVPAFRERLRAATQQR